VRRLTTVPSSPLIIGPLALGQGFAGGGGEVQDSFIFGPWHSVVMIGLYGLILVLGLVFNVAIVWVIVGELTPELV